MRKDYFSTINMMSINIYLALYPLFGLIYILIFSYDWKILALFLSYVILSIIQLFIRKSRLIVTIEEDEMEFVCGSGFKVRIPYGQISEIRYGKLFSASVVVDNRNGRNYTMFLNELKKSDRVEIINFLDKKRRKKSDDC
jgi:hypothetical protein